MVIYSRTRDQDLKDSKHKLEESESDSGSDSDSDIRSDSDSEDEIELVQKSKKTVGAKMKIGERERGAIYDEVEPKKSKKSKKGYDEVQYPSETDSFSFSDEVEKLCRSIGLPKEAWSSTFDLQKDTEEGNGSEYFTVKLPFHYEVSLSPSELERYAGRLEMDAKLCKLLGAKIAASQSESIDVEATAGYMLKSASGLEFIVKDVTLVRCRNEFAFPVNVDVSGLSKFVASTHVTAGFPVLGSGEWVTVNEKFKAPNWDSTKKNYTESKNLTRDNIGDMYSKPPSASGLGPKNRDDDGHYFINISSPLFRFIKGRQIEYGYGSTPLDDDPQNLVDKRHIKIGGAKTKKIIKDAMGLRNQLPVQKNLSFALLRADGKQWTDVDTNFSNIDTSSSAYQSDPELNTRNTIGFEFMVTIYATLGAV